MDTDLGYTARALIIMGRASSDCCHAAQMSYRILIICLMYAVIVQGCSRFDQPSVESIQRDAVAGRFAKIDRLIEVGEMYHLVVLSDGLSRAGTTQSVDRLLKIVETPNEAIRMMVFDHASRLSTVEADRVYAALSRGADRAANEARALSHKD